MVADDAMT